MQPLSENTINVPAFLGKLWRMVNDPTTDHLICWSANGKSFVIQNQAQFWYELLPLYYKHNNMSSFVRQLNMYGFHKMSSVENSMDGEKDEIQFFHPYFQKEQPDLLKNIKRKVTGTKGPQPTPTQNLQPDDLSQILDEIKQLQARQNSVDGQLAAMKHENGVLWQEVALLRQKHLKQQQIVNQLIQFLVTFVQPTGGARVSGLGVKRHFPLMLNESPKVKKSPKASTTSEGPTIHELDNSDTLQEELLNVNETDGAATQSDVDSKGNPLPVDILLDSSELPSESLEDDVVPALDGEAVEKLAVPTQELEQDTPEKIFLNPSTQDTLLSNLINGNYSSVLSEKGKQIKKEVEQDPSSDLPDLRVARPGDYHYYSRMNSAEDLDLHVENTHSEIEQIKDILNGYNSFDANALLGLFNEEVEYCLPYTQNNEDGTNKCDPLVSGSELATYGSGSTLLDFSQLFDDSSDSQNVKTEALESQNSTINTPQVMTDVPEFPVANDQSKNAK